MFTTLAARALLMMAEGVSLEDAINWFIRKTPKPFRRNMNTQIRNEIMRSLI